MVQVLAAYKGDGFKHFVVAKIVALWNPDSEDTMAVVGYHMLHMILRVDTVRFGVLGM